MSETSALRWFAPVPARRVGLVRAVVFAYAAAWLLVRGPYLADVARLPARRFEPIGVLDPLPSPPPGWVILVAWVVSLVAAVSVTAGRRVRLAAPVAAAGLLVLATYASSFGQVFHTEHLLVLHMAVLAVAVVVEPRVDRDGTTSAWPLNLMMAIVAVAYVVAGIAKLRYGGIDWVAGDVLRHAVAMDNLRKLLLEDWYSPVGGWLSSIGWIWGPIAFGTIVVEVGAPLALVPGRARQAWVVLAWGFHVGIFVLMAIAFPYQLFGAAYAAFLPLEQVLDEVRSRLPEWRRGSDRAVGRTL